MVPRERGVVAAERGRLAADRRWGRRWALWWRAAPVRKHRDWARQHKAPGGKRARRGQGGTATRMRSARDAGVASRGSAKTPRVQAAQEAGVAARDAAKATLMPVTAMQMQLTRGAGMALQGAATTARMRATQQDVGVVAQGARSAKHDRGDAGTAAQARLGRRLGCGGIHNRKTPDRSGRCNHRCTRSVRRVSKCETRNSARPTARRPTRDRRPPRP